MGRATQGLFIIETDLQFLTWSSLVLGSVPESVSEIIPVKWYGPTGPILQLKYAFLKCLGFVKLWSAFAFLKRETQAAFPATYALAHSAEKVERWGWLSLFKSGVRDFKSVNRMKNIFKTSNYCSWGPSSVPFNAACVFQLPPQMSHESSSHLVTSAVSVFSFPFCTVDLYMPPCPLYPF